MGEFELIERFFRRPVRRSPLGVGDDCALLAPSAGMQLAVSTDMLVEGRHFLSTVDPERLGHKALAVNLSDLAACGARPLAFTLSLALPQADEQWLQGFSRGLFALADAWSCELVGGDTTRGPLCISITVMGEVPSGQALLRSKAEVGDAVYVSGTLGDARLALEAFRGRVQLPGDAFERVRHAMERPQARVGLGLALRGVARSAVDVSDGLLGDFSHVLNASGVGATLWADALPRSEVLAAQGLHWQRLCTLSGGDDYELVFTAAPEAEPAVLAAARDAGVAVTRIGQVQAQAGLRLLDASGRALEGPFSSFDHFKT